MENKYRALRKGKHPVFSKHINLRTIPFGFIFSNNNNQSMVFEIYKKDFKFSGVSWYSWQVSKTTLINSVIVQVDAIQTYPIHFNVTVVCDTAPITPAGGLRTAYPVHNLSWKQNYLDTEVLDFLRVGIDDSAKLCGEFVILSKDFIFHLGLVSD